MNRLTQQNAALVEELSTSGDSLKYQAQEMQSQVASFRVADNGREAAMASTPHLQRCAEVTRGGRGGGDLVLASAGEREDEEEWEDF
jgi:hypothetical protein